jgi:hypothetical protein
MFADLLILSIIHLKLNSLLNLDGSYFSIMREDEISQKCKRAAQNT